MGTRYTCKSLVMSRDVLEKFKYNLTFQWRTERAPQVSSNKGEG